LVAFNLELAPPATLETAQAIAARVREGGAEGLPGVRALGLWLEHRQVAQVSINVEDHRAAPLAVLVEAVARHAQPTQGELIAPAPAAAFAGFPDDLPVANRLTIEDALARTEPAAPRR
jgi:glutamate formiminotransferase